MDVKEPENGFMETFYSEHGHLVCMHLDWLDGIRENMLETIKIQQRGESEICEINE